MTGPALLLPGRRLALFLWAAMIAMLVLFLGVVLALGRPDAPIAISGDLLLVVAVATSVAGVAISRALPARIPARQAGARPEVAGVVRLVIAWSVCEAVAILPLVAYLVTRDARLLVVFVVDVVALVLSGPTRARWNAASGAPGAGAARVEH